MRKIANSKLALPAIVAVAVVAMIGVYIKGNYDGRVGKGLELTPEVLAAKAKLSPVKARPRDAYFPNSEDLGWNEMRVIACGTGMPTVRPSQAAACFLVELGNGDKFIFDVGTGSAERMAALQIPYNYLDKVFLGHLHTDHFGDLASLFVGGAWSGRQKPLRVWGPSGDKPELGTKSAVSIFVRW